MQIFSQLSNKWTDKHVVRAKTIASKHTDAMQWLKSTLPQKEHLASGAIGGLMLLTAHATSPHAQAQIIPQVLPTPSQLQHTTPLNNRPFIVTNLAKVLPTEVRELTEEEEATVSAVLSRDFNIPVSAALQGKRLNRSYGYIGQEQHLARFPGDTIGNHFDSKEEETTYTKYGMAPGLGAWRYFADSKDTMTKEQSDNEKYYIAVQTFLSPGWAENTSEFREFYKFRKMLVVNPQNGKGVVVVIGDAGPASWTGKHLGGSPEVMKYLERVDGRQKGPVLYFFIDDPQNTIQVGPVEI